MGHMINALLRETLGTPKWLLVLLFVWAYPPIPPGSKIDTKKRSLAKCIRANITLLHLLEGELRGRSSNHFFVLHSVQLGVIAVLCQKFFVPAYFLNLPLIQ